jgi:hypothetical protein
MEFTDARRKFLFKVEVSDAFVCQQKNVRSLVRKSLQELRACEPDTESSRRPETTEEIVIQTYLREILAGSREDAQLEVHTVR